MFVKQFRVGGDRNFAYLAADDETKQALVVDPSYSPKMVVDFANGQGYEILYIFNTHGHGDHSNGNREIEKLTGRRALGFGGKDPLTGTRIADGSRFSLGGLEATVIHTPGHTEDSLCVYVGDALFTGDTLFVGKVGGTGFGDDARAEYDSLHNKLMKLPDETRVFPGHDYGVRSESTIGDERRENPFLLRPDFDSFVDLKMNWDAYKKEHGIK